MADSEAKPCSSVLAVRIDSRIVGVPVPHVVESMRPLPVDPLAGAPEFVLGLAVIRGSATPVVDLAALLTDGVAAPSRSTDKPRFVLLRVGGRSVALKVQEVLAIRELEREGLESLPPLWQGQHPPAVAALGVLDHELFLVLEAARLLPGDGGQTERSGGA